MRAGTFVRRGAGAVAFVAVWALLAVSCGGEVSREEYADELRAALSEVEGAYGDVSSSLGGGGAGGDGTQAGATSGQLADQLRTTQVAIRDAGNRLDEIVPPDDLADEHGDLVAGVRDMADAVDLLIEAEEVAGSDPKRAQELTREFATDDAFERVTAASSAIRDAGVDVDL